MRLTLLVLLSFWALLPPRGPLSAEMHPTWNPSGTEIAFESNREGSADLFVVTLASGAARRLTDSTAADARPVWSPDGRWIAFHSNREGHFDLYVVRPDGSGLRRLTQSPRDETNGGWNPTSSALVYEVRDLDRPHWSLSIIELHDASTRVLIDRPGDCLTPTWLPDGRIAFSYSPPGGNHDTDLVIMQMPASGGTPEALLGGEEGDSNANYSRARGRLAYNSIRDGNWEIYTAPLSGQNSRRLTVQAQPALAGIDGQPAWSPAGDLIAFTSGRAGSLDIVLIDPDGREVRNLTKEWRSAVERPLHLERHDDGDRR